MILLTRHGCIPCTRIKAAIEEAGLVDIEVITKNLAVEQEREEWKSLKEHYGFTLSPVLIASDNMFCGISSISNHLQLKI